MAACIELSLELDGVKIWPRCASTLPNPLCPISKVVRLMGGVVGINTYANRGRSSDDGVVGVGIDKNGLLETDNADECKGNDAFHFL